MEGAEVDFLIFEEEEEYFLKTRRFFQPGLSNI